MAIGNAVDDLADGDWLETEHVIFEMIDVDGVDRVEEEILERRVDLLVAQVAVALFDAMSPDCTIALV